MAYQAHELGSLVRFDPNRAKPKILRAYREADGHVPSAARLLGVAEMTLVRWTTFLRIRPQVDAIRVRAGRRPSTSYNPNGSKKITRRRRPLQHA